MKLRRLGKERRTMIDIKLLEDRLVISENGDRKVFIKAGYYPMIREIKGLGWLVMLGCTKSGITTTVIRSDKGERIDLTT